MIYPATEENIGRAAAVIREGGLVAFPTETVYGLGADARNAVAVQRIFTAKGRPSFNPLIVHIAGTDALSAVAEIPSGASKAALSSLARFWPGPLTVILPKRAELPKVTTGGLSSVAVRVPGHQVARALIAAAGCPLAAPSANPSGLLSPTKAEHVAEPLGSKVDLILDGGPCQVGIESTIVSLLEFPPRILRHGKVTAEELEAALGIAPQVSAAESPVLAPGMMREHYAPRTPLSLWSEGEPIPSGRIGVILFGARERSPEAAAQTVTLTPRGDLEEAARELFAALHDLDKAGLDRILIERCPESGIGRAIMDRLRRAAHD